MKRVLICFLFQSLLLTVKSQTPNLDPISWELVFSDEFVSEETLIGEDRNWDTRYPWNNFHHPGLDYGTSYDKNFDTDCMKGGINHEISNGVLSLITKKENGNFEIWENGQKICQPFKYTTGLIFSKEKYKYGYFEIRCKISNEGQYFFPAFWLWEGSTDGNDYREIDIFEFFWDYPNVLSTNIHIQHSLDCGDISESTASSETTHSYGKNIQLPFCVSSQFHKYGLEWNPSYIAWYVDDVQVRKIDGHSPNLEMHVIVNNAIHPSKEHKLKENNFPDRFEIDYVKVWKHKFGHLISPGSFDTENFYIMSKPNNGFIYNNCFYTEPSKGDVCPDGTIYDGQNCQLMSIPSGGFIYKNNFYVEAENSEDCPPNSFWDTENCLIYNTPWGHFAFEYSGFWYVTPFPKCPPNSFFDGKNCFYFCPPCGHKAFEYSNNWYYTESNNN